MLFVDEAEKFFPRYANGHQVEEVNTYKELMNIAASSGIILMAATNHIDMVNILSITLLLNSRRKNAKTRNGV